MSPRGANRLGRSLYAAVALLVLLALVVVVAGGHRPGGGDGAARPSDYALDTVLSLGLALFAVAAVVTLWLYLSVGYSKRRQQGARGSVRRTVQSVVFGLVVLGLSLLIAQRLHGRLPFHTRTTKPPEARTVTPPAGRKTSAPKHSYQPTFRAVPFALALAVIAAAAVALYAAERRRRRPPREPLGPAEMAAALEEALDDLRAEPDPRRAVIAAYARMERVLAAQGIPRRPFEAPLEYLARVLLDLQASSHSVRRLTNLFERARFSEHEIDAAMKDEAIEAVEALQGELAAAEAEREAA